MIYLKMKSNGWKSCAEVMCRSRSKSKSVYEKRLKSIKLLRAWSFYLSSSSSLLGVIRPSDYCILQPPTSTSTSASIPNGLLASSLVSSWCICTILIRPMIPDVHLQRFLHLIKSGPGLHTLSGLGATGLLPKRPLSFSSVTLTFLKTKLTFAQGRSLSCIQQGFHSHCHQGVIKGDTLHVSTSGWSARRSTTWIIRTSVGRSTILRMYIWRKRRTTSLVAPPIQWEGWLHRLI